MNPPPFTASDFPEFFRALWTGCDPFPWQCEFARRLCDQQAPEYVAVPTGCGKTACLDAAVFALALQAATLTTERTQGRRIFFVVNRRVIVDEAYDRAGSLCRKLREAPADSVVGRVAAALRDLSGEVDGAPLTRVQLRGGIYRDRSWARSLLQPMIICSTVDQAGSRLLFRGYGVSPQAWPVHAALVSQDSLLIIDEAHISRPFIQTLQWVKRYRSYQPEGCETVQLPFQLIQLTATPPPEARDDQKIALTAQDHQHPTLRPRLDSAKPARLVVEPKAKGRAREPQMAERLVKEARQILANDRPASIAIMVNRVATARSVAEELARDYPGRVTLLIGRMRPLDREASTTGIQNRLRTGAAPSAPGYGPLIVVSTQCLEVGADLDFDALVTEAASLDALRQRFGRLNRGGRDIATRAVIVLSGDQDLPVEKLDPAAPCDPIYDNAIPHTWRWLKSLSQDGVIDFGINAMTAAVESFRAAHGAAALKLLLSPTADAPILLPGYLDCWTQTSPVPAAEPEVALFLHGPQREMAEVQVCWRADLPDEANERDWADILSLCPPTGAECLPVPLHAFRSWFGSQERFQDVSGDVEMRQTPDETGDEQGPTIPALVWRGPEGLFFARRATDIRPGDTIVLRAQSGGWQALGHVPDAAPDPQASPDQNFGPEEVRRIDIAEQAVASSRRVAILRVHPALWPEPDPETTAGKLLEMALSSEQNWPVAEIQALLGRLLAEEHPGWALAPRQREVITHLANRRVRLGSPEPYPGNQGFTLTSRDLLPQGDSDETDETDSDALLEAARPEELRNHTMSVIGWVERAASVLPLAPWCKALIAAAEVHDWGKADPRFQAMLRGTTPFAAMASVAVLAKSGSIPSSFAARRAARERAELPEGFRHEMLSVQMAGDAVGATALPADPVLRALTLHLAATHHGYARPFAPVVHDEVPPDVMLPWNGETLVLAGTERLEHPPHGLDSGLAQRFWEMNRHYGWWGIALLEAALRLADQSASANLPSNSKP